MRKKLIVKQVDACDCGACCLLSIIRYYKGNVPLELLKIDTNTSKLGTNAYEIIKAAEKYGYKNLRFELGDINGYKCPFDVDMVITLHACDIATDFALYHAISNSVANIFSVPCCQHEICQSIKKGGDFDLLLNHGLIKERFSALLTDSIRAEILKECGYEVDIVEFVDFAHSPKNLMLRCKLKKKKSPDLEKVRRLAEQYGFTQKLLTLMS